MNWLRKLFSIGKLGRDEGRDRGPEPGHGATPSGPAGGTDVGGTPPQALPPNPHQDKTGTATTYRTPRDFHQEGTAMNRALSLLGGLGLGAGLMCFLDPQQGRRRRALARDRLVGTLHDAEDAFRVAGRDLAHRAGGLAAEARSLVAGGPVEDRALAERVRSHVGRVISHPHAVHVSAQDGQAPGKGQVSRAAIAEETARAAGR